MRNHRFYSLAAAAAAFCGLMLARLMTYHGDFLTVVFDDVAQSAAAILAGVACGVTAWRSMGRDRRAWCLIGISSLSWGLGQTAWTYQEAILRERPGDLFPSWPDVGYLAAVPFGILGLLCFAAAPRGGGARLRAILDCLIIGGSLLFVSWALALGPIYAASPESLEPKIIGLAYPVGDIAMGTILLLTMSRLESGRRGPFVFLSLGVLFNTVADSVFAYLTTVNNSSTTNPADVGWTAGYLLIGLAALRVSPGPTVLEREDKPTRWNLLLPYAPLVAAGLVACWEQLTDGVLSRFIVFDGLGVVTLVLGRQFLALNDNLALNRHLESRVAQRTDELLDGRAQMHSGEQRFRSLVQQSTDVITIIDEALTVEYQSESVASVLGYTADGLLGSALIDLVHEADRGTAMSILDGIRTMPQRVLVFECRMRNSDGGWRYTETSVTSLLDDPNVRGIVLNTRDITDRKELEEQLVHQAFHDSLTGLPNRALFQDRLEHALARQRRRRRRTIGVVFIDLDSFKSINDSLGHGLGDRLLALVAARLSAITRPGDTVARLGGDEFAVLLEDLTGNAEAESIAERLLDLFKAPFNIDVRDVFVRASVGIATVLTGDETADELLRYADLAMYKAKERGKGGYQFFQPTLQSAVVERMNLDSGLQTALEKGQLSLVYQPIVDLRSHTAVAVEALLRWNHPERGVVPPADFIPIAEQSGLIVHIGRWALRTACADTRRWQQLMGATSLSVNVNLSVRQLRDPHLLDDVVEALADAQLSPGNLTLEVTESLIMEDIDEAITRLSALRDLGVRVALDDFGTGYSSFSYLRQIPLDVIKIDRSFVRGIDSDRAAAALVRSIVSLGDTLGLEVVGEGIELPEHVEELTRIGCQKAQGYYFAAPVPADEVISTLLRLKERILVTAN